MEITKELCLYFAETEKEGAVPTASKEASRSEKRLREGTQDDAEPGRPT